MRYPVATLWDGILVFLGMQSGWTAGEQRFATGFTCTFTCTSGDELPHPNHTVSGQWWHSQRLSAIWNDHMFVYLRPCSAVHHFK